MGDKGREGTQKLRKMRRRLLWMISNRIGLVWYAHIIRKYANPLKAPPPHTHTHSVLLHFARCLLKASLWMRTNKLLMHLNKALFLAVH